MTTKISTANLDSSITTLIGSGGGPKVAAITYPGNDLAADTAGGQTITLTGTGFVSGCSVFVGTTQASVVTFISATSVTFTSPTLAAATYTLYLVNPDGGTATIVPGISYSGTPTWSTTAGTLGSIYEYSPISNATTATGDGSISYSVFSGTLPTGSSLNTSTGVITGTSPASAGATTYTFVIRATDAQLQDSDRTFSITVNTDTVTWTTPATTSTVTLGQDVASTTTLLATSAAGNAITYTANALPTGLSISGATVTGTPTVLGNTTSTFTATAATTNRTATAIINWTVSVSGDTYFPYTTLLLSGATATSTFIADASTNNFAVTVTGDTKPSNFNPYTPGYYSNYFDGTGDYLTVPYSSVFDYGTGDFTIEAWIYLTITPYQGDAIFCSLTTGGSAFQFYSSTQLALGNTGIAWRAISNSTSFPICTWHHVAVSRASGTAYFWLNGVNIGTVAETNAFNAASSAIAIGKSDGGLFTGYISNLRVLKGTALYTTTFTPSTTPLTAIANTSLLTCQSNRFVDNSTNAFVVTKYGDTTISPTTPFVPNTQYATYGSTYFDGTTDSLSVPSSTAFAFPSGVNFTAEGWVYLTSYSPGSVLGAALIGTTNGDVNGWFINLGQDINSLRITSNASGSWADNITVTAGNGVPLNTWTHIAFVRNGGSLVLYKNGVSVASMSGASAYNFTSPINSAYIGYISDNIYTRYVTGYISNVRVVKGTAVYTSAFTPPSAPLTAITNTSLLTLQTNQPANNSVFLDSSTNALAVTRVGNTSAGTFTPYGVNWSNYFDGTGDYLTAGTTASNFLCTGSATGITATLEAWVYPTAYNTNGSPWMFSSVHSKGNVYFNFGVRNGAVRFYWFDGTNPNTVDSASTSNVPLNTWTHIAVTISGTTIKIYVNGTLNTTSATYNGVAAAGSGGTENISIELNVPTYFSGYISNYRLTNTIVYSSTFTPSITPLTAISGTQLLTCQSNRFVDNSTNLFAVTKTGGAGVQRFSPFSPGAAYSIGTTGGSAYFDGSGDYLTYPSNSISNFGSGDFTVEGWIYPIVTPGDGSGIFSGASGSGNPVILGYYSGSTYWAFGRNFIAWDHSFNQTPILNTWQHLAVSRSGTTLRLFFNGVLKTTATTSQAYSMAGGGYTGWNGSSGYVTGYVADARATSTAVYTASFTPPTAPLTAITNTSLLLNMTSAGVYDSTMLTDLETVGDAKILSTQTPYAGSYYSNYFGSANYISAASNAAFGFGTGDFTVEAWVYPNAAYTTYNYIWATGVTNGLVFYVLGGVLYVRTYNGSDLLASSTAPTLNIWTHVAVTRSGTTLRIFVNGVQTGTTTNSTNFATGSGIVGNDGSDAAPWLGYISNVRVVKGTAVYTTTFTPSTTPLTAISNTSILTCQSNRFVDNSTNAFALTVSGSPSVQSFNPFQRNSATTMYFDGTGDYLISSPNAAVLNAFGTGNFTVEFWMNSISFANADNYKIIFDCRPLSTDGIYPCIYFVSGQIRYFVSSVDRIIGPTLNTGQWYHVALSRSGSSTKLFVDGTQVGSTYTDTNNYLCGANRPVIACRGYTLGETNYNGYINDLRITKGVARYTSTFTPPTTAFIAR